LQAEKIAARMISDGRMKGTIDQIEGLLAFDSGAEVLQTWDGQISNVCTNMADCLANIAKSGIEVA
jgi:COP9 signalosome complex subunit 4